MTKEEYIEHLCGVINAVFKAEDAISKEWQPKLIAAATIGDKDEREKLIKEYLHAIAEEMIAGYIRSGKSLEELIEGVTM